MTAYSMADLERLAAMVGQGSSPSTSQHQNSSRTYQLPSPKVDIRRDVYTAVMMSSEPISRVGIARMLNLKKTPWLINAIENLVQAGYLNKYNAGSSNGLPFYLYDVQR